MATLPEWNGSPLQRAILDRDLKSIDALAARPALDMQDNYGETPLLTALRPLVREPSAPRLTAAARQADLDVQLEIVRKLLGLGASPDQKGPGGTTPLHEVVRRNYTDEHTLRLLALLIAADADVNARDERGTSALMEAARTDRARVAEFLLEHGADASLTDCAGQTALDIARAAGAAAALRVLASAN